MPLGSRAGSSTEGSKSTLSGGLIPLGNKSRPTASHDRLDFEGEDRDGKGGNSRGWARPEEEEDNASGLRKQGSSGGLHRDEKVRSVISIVWHENRLLTQNHDCNRE